MKKYLITVKGVSYEVEVEEIKGESSPQISVQKQETPAKVEAPKVEVIKEAKVEQKPVQKAPVKAAGANDIVAPMPGSIFKILVKEGDAVKKGDVVLILEAMKMENEIFAAADGVVSSINVTTGTAVNTGDVLVSF